MIIKNAQPDARNNINNFQNFGIFLEGAISFNFPRFRAVRAIKRNWFQNSCCLES
jgi:hypothetical protein